MSDSLSGGYTFKRVTAKKMADKSAAIEIRMCWLDLAGKWLALGDGTYGDSIIEDFGAAGERLRSGN